MRLWLRCGDYLPLPFDHFFFAFPPAGAIVICCAVLVVKGGEGEVNVNVDSQVCVRRRQVSRAHQISLSLSFGTRRLLDSGFPPLTNYATPLLLLLLLLLLQVR